LRGQSFIQKKTHPWEQNEQVKTNNPLFLSRQGFGGLVELIVNRCLYETLSQPLALIYQIQKIKILDSSIND